MSTDQNLVTDSRSLPEKARVIDTRDNIPEDRRNRLLQRYEMIRLVEDTGLDLMCVSGDSPERVYKLLDYGRFKFEQQKKQRESDRKQRESARTLKECFFRPGISEHDYEIKLKQVQGWLAEHDVRIAMKLDRRSRPHLGRNVSLYQVAQDPEFVLNRVIAELGETVLPAKLQVSDRIVATTLRAV